MPRGTKVSTEKLSPSAFMRQLRPELYSDTIDRTTYQLDAPTLGYHPSFGRAETFRTVREPRCDAAGSRWLTQRTCGEPRPVRSTRCSNEGNCLE
jgi:hypothetical protein